jgi:hypothetical protein
MSINLTKISIALLYKRIFGNTRWFRYVTVFVMCITAMYCCASVLVTIFQCTPVPRVFNKAIAGTCIDTSEFYYANAGFSIATDLILLFIPMPLVYQLQIPKIQKVALMFVFALGAFVVVTSCLRMTTLNNNATTSDATWDISATMWTIIEMNIAIVCACLPMIRPLIVRIFPFLRNKSSEGYNHHGHSAGTHAAFGTSKGYIPSHSCDRDASGAIHMSTMRSVKGTDQSSEEYILHDDKERTVVTAMAIGGNGGGSTPSPTARHIPGIQKTVQYSVEYGKEKDGAEWA